MNSSRGSFQPRDRTHVSYFSCIAGMSFITSTTWEAPLARIYVLYLLPISPSQLLTFHSIFHNYTFFKKKFYLFTFLHVYPLSCLKFLVEKYEVCIKF